MTLSPARKMAIQQTSYAWKLPLTPDCSCWSQWKHRDG